jgi:tRNA pseudouridine38-40 synthase
MASKRNIKVVAAYDGTAFHGWQIQPNAITVEETIRKALHKIIGEQAHTHASGRTDAGVHALGQVFNFHTESSIATDKLQQALTHLLPPTICILDAKEAALDFHSRYSAISKHYRYTVFNYRLPYGFRHDGMMKITQPVDIEKMRQGAQHMIGEHDFTALSANPGHEVENPVKKVFSVDIARDGHYVTFDVVGSGFLYKMVRCMVAALIKVGLGKFTHEEIHDILVSRDRSRLRSTAESRGLVLMEVHYPDDAGQLIEHATGIAHPEYSEL